MSYFYASNQTQEAEYHLRKEFIYIVNLLTEKLEDNLKNSSIISEIKSINPENFLQKSVHIDSYLESKILTSIFTFLYAKETLHNILQSIVALKNLYIKNMKVFINTIDSIPTTLEKLFLSIKSFYKKNQDQYENLKNFEKSITTFLQKEKITWNDFRKISIDFEEIISYIKNEMTKTIILYINFMKIITEKNFEEKISTHNSLLQKEEFKKLSFKIDTMSLFFIQPIKSNDLYSLTLIFEYSLILRDCIKELENLNYITIKNTSETQRKIENFYFIKSIKRYLLSNNYNFDSIQKFCQKIEEYTQTHQASIFEITKEELYAFLVDIPQDCIKAAFLYAQFDDTDNPLSIAYKNTVLEFIKSLKDE